MSLTVVVGMAAMGGVASASLSTATATDVGTGLDTATQTVSVDGQSPNGDGGADVYKIHLKEIVANGATVVGATFQDRGGDGDAIADGDAPHYYQSNKTVTLQVKDGKGDGEKKVSFDVVLTLNTTTAQPEEALRYTVDQYDTWKSTSSLSPQTARFDLYGADDFSASTSSPVVDESGVTHSASLTMGATTTFQQLQVSTDGADYSNVAPKDVSLSVGSNDLSSHVKSVSTTSGGSNLTIVLDREFQMQDTEGVEFAVKNAQNPSSDSDLRLAIAETDDDGSGDDRFAGSGTIQIDESTAPTPTPTTTNTTTQQTTQSQTTNTTTSSSSGGSGGSSGSTNTTTVPTNDGGSGGTGGDTGGAGSGGGGGADSDGSSGGASFNDDTDDDSSSSLDTTTTTTTTTTTEMTIETTADTTQDTNETTTTVAEAPGFGIAVVLIAVLLTAIVALRRD